MSTLAPLAKATRPIIFTCWSVQAILRDQKTVTRRPIKPQPTASGYAGVPDCDELGGGKYRWNWGPGPIMDGAWFDPGKDRTSKAFRCRYRVGDVLWIRENCYIAPPNFGTEETVYPKDLKIDPDGRRRIVTYSVEMSGDSKRAAHEYDVHQTSSMRMPRWASRLSIVVEDMRIERLQDITEEDAKAEGCTYWHPLGCAADEIESAREQYARIWDSINRKRGFPWELNPWVFRIAFKVFA